VCLQYICSKGSCCESVKCVEFSRPGNGIVICSGFKSIKPHHVCGPIKVTTISLEGWGWWALFGRTLDVLQTDWQWWLSTVPMRHWLPNQPNDSDSCCQLHTHTALIDGLLSIGRATQCVVHTNSCVCLRLINLATFSLKRISQWSFLCLVSLCEFTINKCPLSCTGHHHVIVNIDWVVVNRSQFTFNSALFTLSRHWAHNCPHFNYCHRDCFSASHATRPFWGGLVSVYNVHWAHVCPGWLFQAVIASAVINCSLINRQMSHSQIDTFSLQLPIPHSTMPFICCLMNEALVSAMDTFWVCVLPVQVTFVNWDCAISPLAF